MISFFHKGKSISEDLPLLLFCKKWGICNQNLNGFVWFNGKIRQVSGDSKFLGFHLRICNIAILNFLNISS